MSTQTTRLLTATFKVGHRFRCHMTLDLAALEGSGLPILKLKWHPKTPRRLSKREMADYRRGRDSLLAELAAIIGARVGVAETNGSFKAIDPATNSMTSN